MSARRSRGRRRWIDVLAVLVLGTGVVGAALLPAVTANSGEVITIRGDVRADDARALPFFPVGFWVPGEDGVVATTQTDASGGFTLDVPATLDGFAFAGAAPDADSAVVSTGDAEVVRGVIGSKAAPTTSTPIYQGYSAATGRSLAGGARLLHFRLQRPGRITGTSPVPADALTSIQVRRLDGSVVQTMRLDARRRFTSSSLAPGPYGVVLTPKAPQLPVVASAAVTSGGSVAVRLGTPVPGATVSGTIRTVDGPVGAGVPVLLERDGDLAAQALTGADGRYSLPGVAAGDYTVEVGRFEPAGTAPTPRDVPIPGLTSTPTPAPTAAPTPTPTPSTPGLAALAPVDRTSDAVLPASVPVEVPATLGTVGGDALLDAAGRVSGTVTGAAGADVQVVAEDPVTRRIVRATTAGADGRYSFGGLVQGEQYDVWAVTRPDDPTLARMGTTSALATAATNRVDVRIDRDALTLQGTVAGATGGRVTAGDPTLLQRSTTVDGSGGYALQGLVPGAYPVVVSGPGRVDADPVPVDLRTDDADDPVDLRPGPEPARFRGWFISGGAGLPVVQGAATDEDGDVVRFDRAVGGRVTASGLRPGRYTYDADGFRGTVPARDGPWFFLAPTGTFELSGGVTTDIPIVLHVRVR